MTESTNLTEFFRTTLEQLQEMADVPLDFENRLQSTCDTPITRTLYVYMTKQSSSDDVIPPPRLLSAVIPVFAAKDTFVEAHRRLQAACDTAHIPDNGHLLVVDPETDYTYLTNVNRILVGSRINDVHLAMVAPLLQLPFGFAE